LAVQGLDHLGNVVIVSFNTQSLRDCCTTLERAEAAMGAAHAQELMTLLSDAEAVDTAAEFMQLYAPNVGVDGDSISLPIGTRYRVSFVAIGSRPVRNPDGGLNWGALRRLKMTDLYQC
jgi:hypothetical protein